MLKLKDKRLKIKKLIMMDEEYTNVEVELEKETLQNAISDGKVIEIFEDGKSIFLNGAYIMSYEI